MLMRLWLGIGLFAGSLALGWWLNRRGRLTEAHASRLVQWIARWPSPIVLCLSFWTMDFTRLQPWLLPLVGMVIAGSTLLPAFLYARSARLSNPETGSFLACAFFSNLGYLGAFTAFALYGEPGYGWCVLYMVYFSPCFYTLGFGIGARYGVHGRGASQGEVWSGEFRFYPFVGMALGFLLSVSGVARPPILGWVNHLLIPVDTALYLMAIGSQVRFESPRPRLRSCVAMSGIKFLYTPVIAWLLANAIGLEGVPRFIVLLEASTPVAVSPMVLPLLFGLDRRLATALWLFTTLLAVPWFFLVIPLLQRW